MANIALSWREAAILSAVLFGLTLLLRSSGAGVLKSVAPFARETGVLVGLYALWQFAGTTSLQHTEGAFARARWIVRVERDWHLPSETRAQDLITGHPWLVEMINVYYATMHFAALFVLLLWMFLRRRDRYAYWRTTDRLTHRVVPARPTPAGRSTTSIAEFDSSTPQPSTASRSIPL
jgi:hypothetical protein